MNVVIISVLEVLAVGFVVWGLFNEQAFIRFEDALLRAFKRRSFKVIKGGKGAGKHCA